MLNLLIDMPHLSGGWIILKIEKCSLTQTHLCTTFERNKLFVHMEHLWDILFQLIRHGNTLHAAFLFFLSISISLSIESIIVYIMGKELSNKMKHIYNGETEIECV
jgi:hypothetical protein